MRFETTLLQTGNNTGIEVPADFAAALDAAGVRAAFDKLAPSHRKEHVRAIEEAKAADTRARRIEKAIEKLKQ